MAKNLRQLGTIFTGVTTNGFSDAINVTEYDFIKIQVATTNAPDGTLFIWGSCDDTEPNWASPDKDNICDKKFVYNENTGGSIKGDTGITAGGGNIIREYKLNVDFINFFAAEISGNSTGEWYVKVIGLNKQY